MFKRHTKDWFINRVGNTIRWEVASCGKLSAVSTMPSQLTIADAKHAAALHAFHVDNKINFKEA